MTDTSHPQSYGVFKPVGHIVIAFPSAVDCREADTALLQAGFVADDIVAYSSQDMLAQTETDLANASGLAAIGQELNLVKAHRALAQQGSCFLVVRARDEHEADQVAEIALRCNASRAQRYGSLLIEELIPVGGSERQVAESNDRGLDAQTRSGTETAQVGTLP